MLQPEILPRWIHLAPRLESLTLSFVDINFERLNFGPLVKSLSAAKRFKELRFTRYKSYSQPVLTMSAFIQVLSIFANPHFSIVVTPWSPSDDIIEIELYRL